MIDKNAMDTLKVINLFALSREIDFVHLEPYLRSEVCPPWRGLILERITGNCEQNICILSVGEGKSCVQIPRKTGSASVIAQTPNVFHMASPIQAFTVSFLAK